MQRWEHAILVHASNQDLFWVTYTAPNQIDDEDYPRGALHHTIGELGGKGWELVAATETARPQDVVETRLYFKRPHDRDRGVRE